MVGKLLASVAAAEVLIVAAIVGVGVQADAPGLVAFGLVWGGYDLLTTLVTRSRG